MGKALLTSGPQFSHQLHADLDNMAVTQVSREIDYTKISIKNVGGWSTAKKRFRKIMWASLSMLLVSFHKVVTQSKSNIPLLERQHTSDTYI